jgi:hypothetical protein
MSKNTIQKSTVSSDDKSAITEVSGDGAQPKLTAAGRIQRLLSKLDASQTTAISDAQAMSGLVAARDDNLAEGRVAGAKKLRNTAKANRDRAKELAVQAFRYPHIVMDEKSIALDLGARAAWVLKAMNAEKRTKVNGALYTHKTIRSYITGIGPEPASPK